MKFHGIIVFTLALAIPVFGQTLPRRTVTSLPEHLDESSGLLTFGRNLLLSHNDSGGDPELYIFDTLGNDLGTISIDGATNVDWEDIACDERFIYIGDFGNNSHDRTDLRIYKIPIPAVFEEQTITAEVIEFWYPDQTEFPPPDERKVFDCEAMVALGDSLYIFSKNWSEPFTRWTKCYSLPKTPGSFEATLLDSFDTGALTMYMGQITAADLSLSGNRLALLGYGGLWVYSGFSGSDFFGGELVSFSVNMWDVTQTEGVSFISENEIFYSDELQYVMGFPRGQKLYYADLGEGLAIAEGGRHLAESFDISAFPNPFNSAVRISIDGLGAGLAPVRVGIFDVNGRMVYEMTVGGACMRPAGGIHPAPTMHEYTWQPDESLPSGVYFVKVNAGDAVSTKRIIFIK